VYYTASISNCYIIRWDQISMQQECTSNSLVSSRSIPAAATNSRHSATTEEVRARTGQQSIENTQWKNTALVRSSDTLWLLAHTTASKAKIKLVRRSQDGSTKNGTHLERGEGREWRQSVSTWTWAETGTESLNEYF